MAKGGGRMKKWIAALCAAALCLVLVLPAAGAENMKVYQLAVNDKFADGEEINPASMPIYVDLSVYVPYTVFDRNSTGVNLGTTAGLTTQDGQQLLVIYNRQINLYFEIETGICRDSIGNYYDMRAVVRNNMVFVPASATCNLLGLVYTYQPITDDSSQILIRITNGNQALTTAQFMSSGRAAMEWRYNAYMRSLEPQPSPSPTPTPTPTPTATPDPDGGEIDHSDVSVCLAFRCTGAGGAEEILTALAGRKVTGLFLFYPEELAQNDTLVRRIVGEGHTVGLIARGETAEQAAAALEEGNRLLERIAWQRTRIALAEGGDGVAEALEEAGWHCWRGNVDGASQTGSGAASSYQIMNALERLNGKQAWITMNDGTASATALARLLERLSEDKYTLRPAVESWL